MTHRFATDATVTVRELCRAAGIIYGMLDGPERVIRLRVGGGHSKTELPHTSRGAIYIDVSGVSDDRALAARQVLEFLAYDVDCYEAGESLVSARIAESLRNGRYQPRNKDTLHSALIVLRGLADELRQLGLLHVAIFGSVARGEDGPESDIDLVVEVAPGIDSMDALRLERLLATELDRDVQIITRSGLDPVRHAEILAAMVEVF